MFLEFQAAFQQAQIYVNAKKVGEHIGGYNGFSIDITSTIKTGDNVVAVRLKTDIIDSTGKVVTTISSQKQIAAGATATFDQTTPAVSNPSLWHPDHPTGSSGLGCRRVRFGSNAADQAPFEKNVLAGLTDMIRIHRNHPSIVAWSMGNEDFFNGGPADKVIALLKISVALTHQLDPPPTGRPAAIGGAQSRIGRVEPATVTITSQGSPAFVEGQTPPADARPYPGK